MMMLCKALIFLFSFWGLHLFIAKIIHTRDEFIPLLTISIISIVIFFAGVFDVLYLVSIIIYVFGLLNAGYQIFYKKVKKLSLHMTIIIAGVALLMVYLYIGRLMHYDNFSHWALMVKDMLKLNAYPTQSNDNIVTFITYPPGSANFIYYVCRFISIKEGAMVFAQSLITFFSLVPLLTLIKRRTLFSYISFLAALCISFTINVQIHDLLVDSILATIGASLTIMIYYYRNDLKRSLPIIVPIMIFVCLIKNSGVFFAIGNIALYLYFYIKHKRIRWNEIATIAVCLSLPFVMTYFWGLHVGSSFSPELIKGAKHTMSFTAYMKNLELLDMSVIGEISGQYFTAIFGTKYLIVVVMHLINAISIITCIFFAKKYRKAIAAINLFGLIYLISLWGMYLFSMPYNEAIDLASFERYLATFVLYYILIMFMFLFISNTAKIFRLSLSAITILTLGFTCDVSTFFYPSYQNVKLKDSGREKLTKGLNKFLANEEVAEGKQLVVKVSDNSYSNDYYSYYVRYMLNKTEFIIINKEDELADLENYYLVE